MLKKVSKNLFALIKMVEFEFFFLKIGYS